MGYDWIFDVLEDLKSFAQANDMPALAVKAEEAMRTAKAEIAAKSGEPKKKAEGLH